MNIAFSFMAPMYEYIGGVQRVTCVLTREFQRRGHKVVFIAFMTEKKRNQYSKLSACYHDLENYQFVAKQYYVNLSQPMESIISDVKAIIQKESVDVLVQQELQLAVFPVLKALRPFVHTVMVMHGKPYGCYQKEKLLYSRIKTDNLLRSLLYNFYSLVPIIPRRKNVRYERQLYRSALDSVDRLCMLSSHFVERLRKIDSGLDYSRVVAINNPNAFGFDGNVSCPKENLVIMVCRMIDGVKNVSDFLKAWRIVEQKHQEWKAELVGDGQDLLRLKSFSQTLQLTNVDFVGYQKDVSSYYRRASMLCVCSLHEGWPMVISEGMAYGCVPICYDTFESVHDLVKDRFNGLIVNSNTPEELAEHICHLIQNPDLREQFSANGKDYVGKFSSANIVKDWESLFENIKKKHHKDGE